jgi:prephenate dehydrogenase
MRDRLSDLISHLDSPNFIQEFIERGNRGRAAIPGKHGGATREYSFLPVIIDDKPGQLASLFHECDSAGVNVEDISIEHSPGQLTGLVILSLSKPDATILQNHLDAQGWNVHSPRGETQ